MTKYQIFTILPQISHFHKFLNFFKYICNFLDQLLHHYKFYVRDMSGILFFIFASCEPLKMTEKLNAPLDSEKFAKNREKKRKIRKKRENREKEENQEGKANSGRFFFTLPLLADRADYVYCRWHVFLYRLVCNLN